MRPLKAAEFASSRWQRPVYLRQLVMRSVYLKLLPSLHFIHMYIYILICLHIPLHPYILP